MEKPFSTSKVTVEYFDPHDVFKLVSPNLLPRLPLRYLNWQSHSGPIRSIDTLHIDLIPHGATVLEPEVSTTSSPAISSAPDDGFTTTSTSGTPSKHHSLTPSPSIASLAAAAAAANTDSPRASLGPSRRHQIPGLRRTSYLKLLFIRCDDGDAYKERVRGEIKAWLAANTPKDASSRKLSKQEGHDASEWMIVHVVLPNTVAATQPRTTTKSGDSINTENKTTLKWRGGGSTLLEKMRADFNAKATTIDRIAQLRIGVNDVPYDLLPRVVPAVPSGYVETRTDVEAAWSDFIAKLKNQILQSFDTRVHYYEDDIKEKDAQRAFAGWNFCTFFILKEGLARGFESVGLVEDALVGYDELSIGLDAIVQEQADSGNPSLLSWTPELKARAEAALTSMKPSSDNEEEETEDLQTPKQKKREYEDIPISSIKKPYRELILANNVSLFDFRCYIFSRQIALLSRLGNVLSTREELLAKLHSMQDAITPGVVPLTITTSKSDETENLGMLAEICRRTLGFIPSISAIMRADLIAAFKPIDVPVNEYKPSPELLAVTETLVSAFAFAVAQQILAQTGTAALPIPPPSTPNTPTVDSKMAFPELPKRQSSLLVSRPGSTSSGKPPPSPGLFPGPAAQEALAAVQAATLKQQVKNGLDDLSARRAELYSLCRNVLEQLGRKKGWETGWSVAPNVVFDSDTVISTDMEDIDLSDDKNDTPASPSSTSTAPGFPAELTSVSRLLAVALYSKGAFYRLYATLTDKALRHYTIAGYDSAVQSHMADLGVLKMFLNDATAAAPYLQLATDFFGDRGWNALELSLLVLYVRALRNLNRKEEFVRIGMKLLTKAALCRLESRSGSATPSSLPIPASALTPISGLVSEVLTVSKGLASPKRIALADFFCGAEITGPVEYLDGNDQFVLSLALKSLLLEELPIEKATLRMGATSGPTRTIILSAKGATLKPGVSRLSFTGSAAIPGPYKVEHLVLTSAKLQLIWDLSSLPPDTPSNLFTLPSITLFQRTSAFNLDITAAPNTRLHSSNMLDVTISPGWNTLTSSSVTVRPSSSGLRLLTSAAEILTPGVSFAKKPEAGTFKFANLEPRKDVVVRFPFTLDSESASSIILRLEASYNTATSTFAYARSKTVDVSLCVGVNVQDVFKHRALYSRFTVSAVSGPLRLFSSDLIGEGGYSATSGALCEEGEVIVFTKQPASILYKIERAAGPGAMTLKLAYTLVRDDVSAAVANALTEALPDDLLEYSLLLREIAAFAITALGIYDLEKALLLGFLPTAFLSSVQWDTELVERGGLVTSVANSLLNWVTNWIANTPRLEIPPSRRKTIEIPVDVPPLGLLVTADITLTNNNEPTVCVNQMVAAVLHLKWTRRWATAPPSQTTAKTNTDESDNCYAYEVSAQADTWLIGGRKKGVLSFPMALESEKEYDISLMLMPLREGFVPFPVVDVRPIISPDIVEPTETLETDWRNLGEVVRVVADRGKVTLSLDASGPGGGPLVLESERLLSGRVVA